MSSKAKLSCVESMDSGSHISRCRFLFCDLTNGEVWQSPMFVNVGHTTGCGDNDSQACWSRSEAVLCPQGLGAAAVEGAMGRA